MNATATGVRIVSRVRIRAHRESVWEALTKTGEAQRFYFDSVLVCSGAPGTPVRYESPGGKHVFIRGTLREFQAPVRFAHTFRFTDLKDEETRAAFELREEGEETELVVTHEGFPSETKTWKRSSKGWPHILGNLKSLLETGTVPFRARVQYRLMKLFLPLFPKEVSEGG